MKITGHGTFVLTLTDDDQFPFTVTEARSRRAPEAKTVIADRIVPTQGGQVEVSGRVVKNDGTLGGSRRTQVMDPHGLPLALGDTVSAAMQRAEQYHRAVDALAN